MNFKKNLSAKYLFQKFNDWLFSNRKRALIIFGLFIVLLFILFSNKGAIKRLQLESEKAEYQKLINESVEEQNKLQIYSRKLENEPAVIESLARVKYGMVKPGEKVYKILPNN
ncbi:MAG: septum formation initiator family protein [Bacteroidetes bacterium]|nr:septum formation initiator family protein [Bacteroidota bacterium]